MIEYLAGALADLAVMAGVAAVLARVLKRIPEESRFSKPWHPWLLLVPMFNLVWAFILLPRISDSLQAELMTDADRSMGDCGRTFGLAHAGCRLALVLSFFPVLFAAAALVFLILYVLRVSELSRRISAPAAR